MTPEEMREHGRILLSMANEFDRVNGANYLLTAEVCERLDRLIELVDFSDVVPYTIPHPGDHP